MLSPSTLPQPLSSRPSQSWCSATPSRSRTPRFRFRCTRLLLAPLLRRAALSSLEHGRSRRGHVLLGAHVGETSACTFRLHFFFPPHFHSPTPYPPLSIPFAKPLAEPFSPLFALPPPLGSSTLLPFFANVVFFAHPSPHPLTPSPLARRPRRAATRPRDLCPPGPTRPLATTCATPSYQEEY